MLTNINIANAVATVAADADLNFTTQDNFILAWGTTAGTATLNTGTTPTVMDAFLGTGAIAYNTANNHLQVVDGSSFSFVQNGINVALVALGNAGGTVDLNGGGVSFTPDVGDGKLALVVTKDGSTLNLALDGTGTVTFGTNGIITIPKDFSLSFNAITYTGIPLAGTIHGDGVNDFYATLVNGTQILITGNGVVGGNLSLGGWPLNNVTLSGSIVFDPINSALTFAQGSTLGVDMGTRHISFTATDNAGGQFTFGANGLTFNTAGGDGGLILSVTENGATRQAYLDVVGSLTYSLDGSITLAQGTVVKNIFEDGNVLTITANTEASGSIVFDPQGGLFITPTTPDALNIVLNTEGLDVVNISSITGTINYSGGLVTASDGAQAHLMIYDTWESELRVSGGTASLQFTGDRTVYTANEGTTFVLDYLDGSTVEIQNGSFSDIYATETSDAIELVSAGSNFKANDDEFIFTLETAGNYTLNGIPVVTTADNVQVQLTNYDTIIVDGLSYTPLDANAALALDNTGVIYSTGNFAVNSFVASADLAGDFLPNYDNDFNNALLLADAGSFDTQLTDLLPTDTTRLGEISFDTQIDELSKPQLVIAPDK